jgi:hypothetical protein
LKTFFAEEGNQRGETKMNLLAGVAVLCVVWAVVSAVLIARDLSRRGVPVSFVWLRVMILKYLHVYAKVTQEQTGRVGPLFYHYVVSLNVALVIAILLAILSRS